jgi:hypothetical protein
MGHILNIAGQPVTLEWTQDIARRLPYRISLIGGFPTERELSYSRTATAAITKLIWLFLPPLVHSRYSTPEELFLDLNHREEASQIHAAVSGICADMVADEEKKTSSQSSPSPESSSV